MSGGPAGKKGLAEGELNNQIKVVKRMIARGLSFEVIADFLGRSVDRVRKLAKMG